MFATNVRNERSINMTGADSYEKQKSRVKAQRRTFMLGLMVLTVIVIGSVLLGTIRTQAAPAEPSYKYYTSIQIQKGDTLWNIADEYITDDYDSMDEYMEKSVRSITSCRGTFIPDSI